MYWTKQYKLQIQKKRILMMIPLPPPYHGASIQSQMISRSRLLNKSFNIRRISISFADGMVDLGHFSLKKIGKMFCVFWKLIWEMTVYRPRIVYYIPTTGGISFWRDCFFIFTIHCFRIPLIFHHRLKLDLEILKNPVRERLHRWMLKDSYSIVLSPLLVKNISSFVPEEKIFIVPNGIPDIDMPQADPENTPPTLLFLSNMMKGKGSLLLLKALHCLKERDISFKAVFAGAWTHDISPLLFSETLRKFDLESDVTHVGPVYGRKKLDVILGSQIFVFPTFLKHETFGNVVLEAMRAGLPVLASDEGSLPFIVDDGVTGLIFEKRDLDSLIDKLEQLICDRSLRSRMGRAGRERFKQVFVFERAEADMKNCFRRVLENVRI